MAAISTLGNLLNPLAKSEMGSMLQINGRAIFQRKRVETGHQENRQRLSRGGRETGSFGWNRGSSYNEWSEGRVREARAARFAGLKRSRSDR